MAPIVSLRGQEAAWIQSFQGWLEAQRERRARRRAYNTAYRELSMLSNRELADIGLSRSQIGSVAYEAAYGEPR